MKLRPLLILLLFIHGCSSEHDNYYTKADFATVDKADVHAHIQADRDAFAEKAAKDNIKLITIALDADNRLDSVKKLYHYSIQARDKHPKSIAFSTAFSMEGWDEPGWLEKNMAWLDSGINAGAVAVKVWKNIGMVYRDKAGNLIMIDNPRFDPIFKMLAKRKITVLGHLGEPKNCWLPLEKMTTRNDSSYFSEHPQYHMYKHPDMPSYEAQIEARDKMLEKNPHLIFVGAHLGSLEWDVDELAKRLDRFPNMAAETAARMGQLFYQTHYDREKVRDFLIKYQDRILYGTDLVDEGAGTSQQFQQRMHETLTRDWRFFVTDDVMTSDLLKEDFKGLKLPRKVVDKIYYHNAQKWFHVFENK